MFDEPLTVQLKVILLGDARVGKTSIRKSYFGDNFAQSYSLTVGADFAVKRINRGVSNIVLQIWDIAGQKDFQAVRRLYYDDLNAIVLIFSLVDPDSFDHLDNWIEEVTNEVGYETVESIPIVLVGNKLDLIKSNSDDIQIVNEKRVLKKFEEYKSKFDDRITLVRTSAKSGENVEDIFKFIIEKLEENGLF